MNAFLFLVMSASPANAQDCAALRPQIDSAWAAFDDAEVQRAREVLDGAVETLECQQVVVNNDDLLEMFRLRALVALSLEDKEGAVFWTIRTVVANPRADPPGDLGPELSALYGTWSTRLLQATVTVTVEGGGTIYIDGRPVTAYTPLSVVEGQHLVQVAEDEGGLDTQTNELTEDTVIATGLPSEPPPEGWVPPEPEPDPEPIAAPLRRHPQGVLVAGVAVTGLGVAGVGYAFWAEGRFQSTDFKNRDSLNQEARRIQSVYGVSYAIVGVGAAFTLTSVIGLPVSTDGATVQVGFRW